MQLRSLTPLIGLALLGLGYSACSSDPPGAGATGDSGTTTTATTTASTTTAPTTTATTTTLPDGAPPPPVDGGPPPTDGGPRPGNVVGNDGIAAWKALSAAEKAKVGAARTLFLHMSVGQDLENGVEANGVNFRTYSSGSTAAVGLNGGIFRSGFGVDNGNPTQKVQVWQTESAKAANNLNVAIMKYGYADVTAPLLATAKSVYATAVTALKAKGIKVVHVTPPLVFDTRENPPKLQLRDWMFATFPSDPIFDLVDVESTNPSTGARCEVGGVWQICQGVRSTAACLSDQSGPGGDDASQGHLCPTQATRLAPAFLYAIYLAVK